MCNENNTKYYTQVFNICVNIYQQSEQTNFFTHILYQTKYTQL